VLTRRNSGDQWTKFEATTLLNAIRHAPVLHPERPYVLQLGERAASLFELGPGTRYERAGVNRLLYCGTALANLFLAMRVLGWRANIELAGDGTAPDLVATVKALAPAPPTDRETLLHRQIERMHPYWAEPTEWVPDSAAVAKLVASNWCPGTELRLLSDRTAAMEVARLVLHAGRRMDGDRWCADELAPWLTPQQTTPVAQLAGQFGPLATMAAEPYADAVCSIAARLVADPILVVTTSGDTPRDHVLAGAAIQNARLSASAFGLAIRPVTRLIKLDEVREGLARQLGHGVYPHALLRIGGVPAHM
jgi:hypothetical protein